MVCCVTADSLLNKKHVKRTTLSMAVEASGAELKQACHRDSHAKWQGPIGCIKPEAIPSLHVKHAMCGLSNQPSEGKRHIFCNHLWLVVSPAEISSLHASLPLCPALGKNKSHPGKKMHPIPCRLLYFEAQNNCN